MVNDQVNINYKSLRFVVTNISIVVDIPREPHPPTISKQSEHNRSYLWPEVHYGTHRPVASPRHSAEPDHSLHATLFPTSSPPRSIELADGKIEPLLSEYRQQYDEKAAHATQLLHAPVTARRDSGAPTQFAWSLANPSSQYILDDQDDDVGRSKPKSAKIIRDETSEQKTKYKWPVQYTSTTENQQLLHQFDEMHAPKVGKVFALDDRDLNANTWKTEYDEQYTKLREKQQALRLQQQQQEHGSTEIIAGVPTAQRPNIPRNFAWKMNDTSHLPPPPPPQSTTAQPFKVGKDHFLSEYDEKYLKWQADNPSAVTRSPSNKNYQKNLNLFDPTQQAAVPPRQFASEYDAQFLEKSTSNDNAFIQHIKDKATTNHAPPQFAWPLVDPAASEKSKLLKKQPSSSKPFNTKTEYDTKFQWPQVSTEELHKRKTAQDQINHNPMPHFTDDESRTQSWQSEYDRNNLKSQNPNSSSSTVTTPPAGIIALRTEDIPSFFAWADDQLKKPSKKGVTIPEQPTEVVRTEYHDQFHSFPTDQVNATRDISRQLKTTVLQGHKEAFEDGLSSSKNNEYHTEYRDNFIPLPPPPPSSSSSSNPEESVNVQTYRPPQFAWPRVDSVPDKRPKTTPAAISGAGSNKISEYDSKYMWPQQARTKPILTAAVDHFEGSMSLLDTQQHDEHHPSKQWQSEYDERCVEMRKKQQDLAHDHYMKSTEIPIAGKATELKANIDAANRPAFFTWDDRNRNATDENNNPVLQYYHNRPPLPPTENSEYRERFINWQDEEDKLPPEERYLNTLQQSNLHRQQARHMADHMKSIITQSSDNPSKANTTNPTNAKFVTEYDDQYRPETTISHFQPPKIIRQQDVYRPTLPFSNLDNYHRYHDAKTELSQSLPHPKHSSTGQGIYRTEYDDNFHWQTPPQPPVTTQKLKADAIASKVDGFLRSDANKENAASTLNSAFFRTQKGSFFTGKSKDDTCLSEYQRQFSWPEDAKRPEIIPDPLQEEKKRLMIVKQQEKNVQKKNKIPFTEKSKDYKLMQQNNRLMDNNNHCIIRSPTFGRATRFRSSTTNITNYPAETGPHLISTTSNMTNTKPFANKGKLKSAMKPSHQRDEIDSESQPMRDEDYNYDHDSNRFEEEAQQNYTKKMNLTSTAMTEDSLNPPPPPPPPHLQQYQQSRVDTNRPATSSSSSKSSIYGTTTTNNTAHSPVSVTDGPLQDASYKYSTDTIYGKPSLLSTVTTTTGGDSTQLIPGKKPIYNVLTD
jgi:hypothetical protein